LRGEARGDGIIHEMTGWTTRKDYTLYVGISLPIPDRSFDGAHEAQLWEELLRTDEPWVVTENHAEFVYTWLMNRITIRSTQRMLPVGMPELVDEVTVTTKKDGKAGYIMFTPRDMIATSVRSSETKIMVEYEYGYMFEGIGNAYTIRTVFQDFMALTQNQWELYPAVGYRRLIDGTIVHKCTRNYREGQQILAEDAAIPPPIMVIEERGRGTEIHSIADQGRLLQYWAWARLPLEVGIIFPTSDGRVTEF
jgi:hypothetical protein